jgi:hypothetical protein
MALFNPFQPLVVSQFGKLTAVILTTLSYAKGRKNPNDA